MSGSRLILGGLFLVFFRFSDVLLEKSGHVAAQAFIG